MKIVFCSVIIMVGLSACSAKKEVEFYDRANSASEKSLSDLQKDSK